MGPAEQQQFAAVLGIPRIATYVDPATIPSASGLAHDGAWIVELAIDRRPIGCILDGTIRMTAVHARQLEALAFRLPQVPTVAVALPSRDAALDAWMTRWPDPQELVTGEPALELAHVDDARDPDNLTRLCAHDELRDIGQVLIVTSAARSPGTPAALAALRHRMPELRPIILSTEPLAAGVLAALAIGDAAYVHLGPGPLATPRCEPTWTAVALAITPGREVALEVRADAVTHGEDGVIEVARPRPLHASDVVRLDAVTRDVDEPVFAVRARMVRTDLPLACTVFHVARRTAAGMPTAMQGALAEVAMRIVPPVCTPLAAVADRDVDGVVVFDIAGQVQRVRLLPAMRVAGPTATLAIRVVRGEVHAQVLAGEVLYAGHRIEREVVVAPYQPVVLDGVRATFAVRAAWPDEQPEVIIEGELERYPRLLEIDGTPIELRRRARHDELWCEGRPLTIAGTLTVQSEVEHLRATEIDLSWLLHAARAAPVVGRNGLPITIAEQHGIAAHVVVDLTASEVTVTVRRRHV
ncbi:MAG: hypothetical protein ABI867_24850 [Kofleriaceae bacterium]